VGTITLFEDADIISGAEAQELIDCIAIVDRNLVGFVEAGDAQIHSFRRLERETAVYLSMIGSLQY
jgi:hypothetical protein